MGQRANGTGRMTSMSDNENQSTRNAGRASSRSKKASGAGADNPEIKPQKDSDEVLGAIEGVEKQLDALRGAHEEQRKITAELSVRRAQIQETADQVESRETELTTREVELAEMRQDLESREADIAQRASGLEQRESQLAHHAESIEGLEAVVESKSKQIDQRVEELDKQLEGISNRKDELAKLEEQARARIEHDSELETKIGELANDLDQTKAALSGREIELKERAKVIEDLAIQAGKLEKQMSEISAKSKADEQDSLAILEEMQGQLDNASDSINGHDSAMKRALERIDELESIASGLDNDLNAAKETISKHGSSDKASKESFDQLQLLLDHSVKDLKKSNAHAESLQEQLKSADTGAAKELKSAKAQVVKLTEELSAASSGIKDAQSNRDKVQLELQAKLEQAIRSGKQFEDLSGTHQSEISQLQSNLHERDEQIHTIRAKYDEISDQLIEEQSVVQNSQAEIDKLENLLKESSEQEALLTNQITELKELLDGMESEGSIKSDEWTTSRKERLSRMKSILRVQSDKIRRATEALRDRYDQCEQVLVKRAELVEAYQAVTDAQAKLSKREARSGALLGLSGFGLLVMLIAGLSWFVSGQIAPGAYASSITLTAKAGERTLTTDDIASWQGYVEQLVTDPQFIEKAAQGMKRRGITDLAVAGTLSAHMSDSLDVVVAEPGSIQFEYRGQGPARTQRILDTFALTISAQANAARARRIDGALTSIVENASVGQAPLDTARIQTAGMIFGSSSVATFALGGLFWRRLAKVKAKFERDSRVEPLFDESSWEVAGKDD